MVIGRVFISSSFAVCPPQITVPTPQPQKPPCNPITRIGGVVKAFDGFQTSAAAFTLAGVHIGGAVILVGGGCLDPTPFEPATCIAGGFYKRGCQEKTLHLMPLGKIFF